MDRQGIEFPSIAAPEPVVRPDFTRLQRLWRQQAVQYATADVMPPAAGMQRRLIQVTDLLLDRLEDIRLQPARVLLCGVHTARMAARVRDLYPGGTLTLLPQDQVTPGSYRLPFADHAFDLILSNLTLHWFADPRRRLREYRRILGPEGLLLFSTLGSESLHELRTAFARVEDPDSGPPRILPLPTLGDLGQALLAAPLRLPVVDRETGTLRVPSVLSLVRHLRQAGSSNPYHPHHVRPPVWTGKAFWRAVELAYPTGAPPATSSLPVTFEVIFGHGWH